MKNGNSGPDWDGLDLTAAMRILEHAGKPNPLRSENPPSRQIQELIDTLCDLCLHDGLTGLVNASFFHAALSSEIDRSWRTGRSCGLLLLDLDHFKQVNDSYGHHTGDEVLKLVALRILQSLRKMDTAARIGGEEFAVILPECTPEDAVIAARRIHSGLNPLEVHRAEHLVTVTSSGGLVWNAPESRVEPVEFISLADQELYRAKRSGRRMLCHPEVAVTQVTAEEKAALAFRDPADEDDDE